MKSNYVIPHMVMIGVSLGLIVLVWDWGGWINRTTVCINSVNALINLYGLYQEWRRK